MKQGTMQKWHRTRSGYLVFSVFELVIAYGFGSLSIARGNLWWYLLTIIFLIGALKNLFHLIGAYIHGKF
jgi:fatty acid desaturase